MFLGIIAGFIIGMIIPDRVFGSILDSESEMALSWEMKSIVFVLELGIIFTCFHFFEPTILTVTMNFFIVMAVSFLALQTFGVPAQSNKKKISNRSLKWDRESHATLENMHYYGVL